MIGMMTVGFANPTTTNGNTKECKETYEGIKALLDKELITIEAAQILWKKWEKQKHSTAAAA